MHLVDFRRSVRNAIGPAVIDLLHGMVRRRTWQQTQCLGRRLGRFGYRCVGRYRKVALDNVKMAFGDELSDRQVQEIAQGALENVTTLFLEALRLTSMTADEVRAMCALQGEEHIREALAQGRGVVLFCGHIGNWEIGAVRLIHDKFDVLPLSRPPSSPRLAAKFREVRQSMDFPIIPVAEGLRGIFRALKANCIVPVMPDRFAKGQGVTVPFFGRDTHVWHTPALLASRTNCAVLPSAVIRQADGSFIMHIDPPVKMAATDDRDADLVENTARLMAVLEKRVRAHPDQYAWHYKLWRPLPDQTSPPGDGLNP